MCNPARQAKFSGKPVRTFPDFSGSQGKVESLIAYRTRGLAAFSFAFVAKPEQAVNATLFLPAAIQSRLGDTKGFAGSLVTVSDQEARLITVMVFWQGSQARKNSEPSIRRVRALLAPYLHRCLRAQNLLAHLPAPQNPQTRCSSPIDTRSITRESIAQQVAVGVV